MIRRGGRWGDTGIDCAAGTAADGEHKHIAFAGAARDVHGGAAHALALRLCTIQGLCKVSAPCHKLLGVFVVQVEGHGHNALDPRGLVEEDLRHAPPYLFQLIAVGDALDLHGLASRDELAVR